MRVSRGGDLAARELQDYFQTCESVGGLGSSWTPLVGIATGGATATRDPERQVVDGRFRLGSSLGAVGRHREIRRALLALPKGPPSAVDCLWVAHGPIAWGRVLDAGLGAGTAQRVGQHLDLRLVGVALLTPEVVVGTATWEGRDGAPVGAWIAHLVRTSHARKATEGVRGAALSTLSEIGRSARRLLASAEDAYRDARSQELQKARVARAPRRSRGVGGIDDDIGF